jgi:hypothetical protein
MAKRAKKTPESAVGSALRKSAIAYRADGQKEYAAAFMHAADMADAILAKGVGVQVLSAAAEPEDGSRIAELEERVGLLENSIADILASVKSIERERPPPLPQGKSNGAPRAASPALPRTARSGELEACARRILSAVQTRGTKGASADELTAMIDLRATSLRTYMSLLRTEGMINTVDDRTYVTPRGAEVLGLKKLPTGNKLLNWWMSGNHLDKGERAILEAVPTDGGPFLVADLVGDLTNLKETSVRTYISSLVSRCLIRRSGKGSKATITLAPILLA